jgi:hypothetical protein
MTAHSKLFDEFGNLQYNAYLYQKFEINACYRWLKIVFGVNGNSASDAVPIIEHGLELASLFSSHSAVID